MFYDPRTVTLFVNNCSYISIFLISTTKMPDVVAVSHKINMGPLADEFIPIARRQGEDPDMTCSHLEELRNLIFG